ncbi:MAG: DUF1553 domain-containing protein [Phycisphaerales bacterium]
MRRERWMVFGLALGVSLWAAARAAECDSSSLLAGPGLAPRPTARDDAVVFSRDIKPIFARRCNSCHFGQTLKSGLSVGTRESLLAGGDSGEPAIVPGDGAASHLYRLVAGLDPLASMPPKGGSLRPEQIDLIKRWIDQGAPWDMPAPLDAAAPGGGPRANPRSWHWSYQPLRRPEPPRMEDGSLPGSPSAAIDAFIEARLSGAGLQPSPPADRATLIRRLWLDLIGLPPTPEQADAFIADDSPDAYERLVDGLLSSPRFGEHWARMWLDLARYADSHGYEKDGLRVMWPYRDWVIDAFNRDLPYDRFIIEQLAGDQFPRPTRMQLVATGFHRNTQINEEGGTDPEEFRIDAVIDRVNTTASVFLGTTLGCAQCHDHKFDPISQREYFQMLAFFNQDAEDAVVVNATATEKRAGGPMVPVPRWEHYEEFDRTIARRDAARKAFTPHVGACVTLDAARLPAAVAAAGALRDLDESVRGMTAASALVMGPSPAPRESHVFIRGSFLSPGDAVEPGVPAVLEVIAGVPEAPTRLGLARWIASPANPLTARVHVNRVWSRLMGRGLVETEDDFGIQGDDATHPELLDFLACEFIARGWSQKALLKTIVMSQAYQRSSGVGPGAQEADPANRFLARAPRFRLDAEVIRDNALAAAGLLSSKMFGPSVFPPQPQGIWTQIYSGERWTQSTGEDGHRRGLYTFARRTSPYPTFTSFDAPSREVVCTRRPRTNTPLQALTTLNDPQFVEAAGALATRMHAEAGPDTAARIRRGFRLVLTREPDAVEMDRLEQLHRASLEGFRQDPAQAAALVTSAGLDPNAPDAPALAALTVVASVLLNLDETITRE